jgi:hypothetical protein
MEKLHLSIVLLIALFFSEYLVAQTDYCVFKVTGEPTLANGNTLKKGTVVSSENIIKVGPSENVLLVDENGQLYDIGENKEAGYDAIPNFKRVAETASFSEKYLSYVWKKFIKQKATGEHLGVAYRNDRVYLQLAPNDSIKIYIPEIHFSWATDEPDDKSYFLIRKSGSDHMTKVGVVGNKLHLFVDNRLLQPGEEYQWAVSKEKFPDLTSIKLQSFTLLTAKQFKELKPEIDALKADMITLGFTEGEIKEMLCTDYKLCY